MTERQVPAFPSTSTPPVVSLPCYPCYGFAYRWFGFRDKPRPVVLSRPPLVPPIPYVAPSTPQEGGQSLDLDTGEPCAWGEEPSPTVEHEAHAAAAGVPDPDVVDVSPHALSGEEVVAEVLGLGLGLGPVLLEADKDEDKGMDKKRERGAPEVVEGRREDLLAPLTVAATAPQPRILDLDSTFLDMQVFALRMNRISVKAARCRKRMDAVVTDPFARVGLPPLESPEAFDLSVSGVCV